MQMMLQKTKIQVIQSVRVKLCKYTYDLIIN